jgi:DNA repair exonuclease SbcCD nuclease subunit
MKVVISSDWHADKSTLGVDRFDDVARAARQTVDVAIREDADLYAFLGDLTDPDDGPRAFRAIELAIECATKLARYRIRNAWIAGNHDVIEDASGRTTLSPLSALDTTWTQVIEFPGHVFEIERPTIALPYPPVSRPFDLASEFKRLSSEFDPARPGLVLAHATYIPGAVEGEETLEMPRGRAVPLPVDVIPKGWVVANGHMHTPQVTPGGVLIPGALARFTRGEARNDPRFIVLEI